MKIYSNILLFLIFTLSANSQTSKIEKLLIKNGDTISFQKTGFNSYREIALLENKEFIKTYISVGCYPGDESKSEQHFGKYELIDSILLLKPNMVEIKTYSNGKTRNEKLPYDADSLKFETEFKILELKEYQFLVPINYNKLSESKINQYERKFKKLFFNRKL